VNDLDDSDDSKNYKNNSLLITNRKIVKVTLDREALLDKFLEKLYSNFTKEVKNENKFFKNF
jgi:hypothetical protein